MPRAQRLLLSHPRGTPEDFDRAVRKGVARDGHNPYPAVPYVSYAKISDDDVKARYAYFKYGVAPVSQAQRPSDIPWPLNMRWPLTVWNWVFLKDGPYQAKRNQSVAWNRGAYLVQGLAHCSTCHTPRGFAMQEKALDESGSGFPGRLGAGGMGWLQHHVGCEQRDRQLNAGATGAVSANGQRCRSRAGRRSDGRSRTA